MASNENVHNVGIYDIFLAQLNILAINDPLYLICSWTKKQQTSVNNVISYEMIPLLMLSYDQIKNRTNSFAHGVVEIWLHCRTDIENNHHILFLNPKWCIKYPMKELIYL